MQARDSNQVLTTIGPEEAPLASDWLTAEVLPAAENVAITLTDQPGLFEVGLRTTRVGNFFVTLLGNGVAIGGNWALGSSGVGRITVGIAPGVSSPQTAVVQNLSPKADAGMLTSFSLQSRDANNNVQVYRPSVRLPSCRFACCHPDV